MMRNNGLVQGCAVTVLCKDAKYRFSAMMCRNRLIQGCTVMVWYKNMR